MKQVNATEKNSAPAIGHNNPPLTIDERLIEDYGRLAKSIDDVVQRASEIASIDDDDDFKKAGDLVVEIRKFFKSCEEFRKFEIEEPTEIVKTVNNFFKGLTAALDTRKTILEKAASIYTSAKAEKARLAREAERIEAQKRADALREQSQASSVLSEAARNAVEKLDDRAAKLGTDVKDADLVRTRSDSGTVATTTSYWHGELSDIQKIDLNLLKKHFTEAEINKAIRSFVRDGGRELAGAIIEERSRAQFR